MLKKKMLLIFSHQLTKEQEKDAKDKLNVEEFIYLNEENQKIWSSVPTDLESLSSYLDSIKEFIKVNSNRGDLVLIQGDFGATYIIVNFSKELGLMPVYATTKREVKEYMKDGESVKETKFKHRRFRGYEYY